MDVVTNDVSGRQTPSAIYFAGDHRLIGEHSAGHAGSNPRNLINHLKYLLQDRRSESSSMPTSFSPKPLHMADATTRRRGPSPRGSDRGSGGGGGGGGFEKTLPLPAVKQGSRDTGVGVQGKQTQLDSVDSGEEQDEDVPKQQQQQQQQPNTSGPPEVLVTSESERDNSNNIPRGRREGVPEDEKLDIISSSCSLSSITTAESMFFCKTRSPEDADHAGRVAVVKHMGEELELGASEAIAYLLGHCAEVVSREAGNRAAGGGGEVGVGETTAAAAVSSCVVASVPSHFTLRQRKAVLDAARIAGVPMPMVRARDNIS